MYDVITVGSSTLDVFAKTQFSELIKIKDPRHETDLLAFPSGSKILINKLEHSIGGSGTNAGVSLARLGHKIAYLGKIGKDSTGEVIQRELIKEGVDILAHPAKGFSGYSIILETLENDRTILTYKGINDCLLLDDVPLRKLKTKWFYFGSMMGESYKTQEKLAKLATKNKIKVAFNPSNYLAEKGAKYVCNMLAHTELLTLNKDEAEMLVGCHSPLQTVKKLHELGPALIVMTNGKREALVYADKYLYSIKPPKTKVVDCTGAGDAFSSGFLSGVLRKRSIEVSMRMGIANSASVIGQPGAKNHLLSKKEMDVTLRKLTSLKVKKKKI